MAVFLHLSFVVMIYLQYSYLYLTYRKEKMKDEGMKDEKDTYTITSKTSKHVLRNYHVQTCFGTEFESNESNPIIFQVTIKSSSSSYRLPQLTFFLM
jgi:hypothetical protein